MKWPNKGTAYVKTFRPCDAGMAGLEARKAQPDVGTDREIEMGGGPEALGREVDDLHCDARSAALAQARGQVDRGALDIPPPSRRPCKGRGGRELTAERNPSALE